MAVLVGRAVQFKEPVLLIGETGCAALGGGGGGGSSRSCVPLPPCAMLACVIVKNFKAILNLNIATISARVRCLDCKGPRQLQNSFVNMV